MSYELETSINFRASNTTKQIAKNVCDRNGIKKQSDLHRMAYMLGMERVLKLEGKAKNEGDLMMLMAHEVSSAAKKRMD